MSALHLLNHLLNFAAPALFVALLLALSSRLLFSAPRSAVALWKQVAVNFVAGLLVLTIGLGSSGRDGEMMTYAALVVVCGVCQWLLAKAWRG